MTPERQRLAESIFLSALERERTQRVRYVRDRCGSDLELVREVESLLGFAGEGDGPLERIKPLEELGHTPAEHQTTAYPRKVGHYDVRGVLGEGGMGVVYLAEQERPKRTVALKVIRPGQISPSILRRFEHEAELLGRLQHPGIAQIFEAGTADAGSGPQPFFAMELVQGQPLTQFANERGLDLRARVELVRKICDAVEHAHRRGVIHRDLKPANVLVDASGQPKILDFGVARASESDLGVSMLRTTVGQLIGTLPYMSPEQVVGNPDEIDTRCDVYALGVILYELLAGRLPHNLSGKSLPEAVRIIRDVEPAALDSLVPACRGDLATIAARAMAKDRLRRYQSASELGAEIERHVTGHPIEARRDSALYVLGRQVRRHRVGAAGALAFVALLAVATGVSLNLAEKERRANEKLSGALTQLGEKSAQLRAELTTSNIERGKLMVQRGDGAGAEGVLWREWMLAPESSQAAWALRELYARYPSVGALRAGPATHLLTTDGRNHVVAFQAENGPDEAIEVWTTDLRTRVCEIPPSQDTPQCISLSLDGSLLVLGKFSGGVAVWDAHTGAHVKDLTPHKGPVRAVLFSSDGERVWSAGEDAKVMIESARSGDAPVVAALDEAVNAMALSPSGPNAVCVTRGRTIALIGPDGTVLKRTSLASFQSLSLAEFHPSGASVVVGDGTSPSRIAVLSVPDLELMSEIEVPVDPKTISFINDGTEMVVGQRGLEVLAYPSCDSLRYDLVDRTSQHRARALGDGKFISVSSARLLRVFDTNPESAVRRFSPEAATPSRVRFSPDGRLIAVHGGRQVMLLARADLSLLAAIRLPSSDLTFWSAIAFSADGAKLAFSADLGNVCVLDVASGARKTFAAHTQRIRSLAFSPDGAVLATGSHAGDLKTWNLADTTQPLGEVAVPNFASTIEFLPNGKTLLINEAFGRLVEYSVPTLSRVRERGRDGGIAADVSDDGARVVVARWKGPAEIVTWGTDEPPVRIGEGAARTGAVRFSHNGQLVASAGLDGTVRVWDARTGVCLFTEDSRSSSLADVEFSPDDSQLAWVGENAGLSVLDFSRLDPRVAGHAAVANRFAPRDAGAPEFDVLAAWEARGKLQTPGARAPGVDPQVVRAWGADVQR